MENNEIKFAKTLEDVKYQARSQGGFISKEDVTDAFAELSMSDEQMEMVFDYLKKNNIGVDAPLKDYEYLSESDLDIVKEYEEELANVEKLSDGEVRALLMAAMNNDTEAINRLSLHYLPQVLEISKLYSTQGVLIEDLIGEGNLAVMEGMTMLGAMENIDEADSMITKLIMDSMEEIIKENLEESTKDEKLAEKVNKVSQKAHELAEEIGRKVTVDELAENSGLSKKAIIDAIKMSSNQIEDIEYSDDNKEE